MTTTAGLTWAIKDSLVSYVEGLADGTVETLAPASRAAHGFWFPRSEEPPGTAAADAVHVWQFLGAVRLTGHWGALDVELRDPRVELDGGHGTLLVRERGGRDPDARLPFADLGAGRAARGGRRGGRPAARRLADRPRATPPRGAVRRRRAAEPAPRLGVHAAISRPRAAMDSDLGASADTELARLASVDLNLLVPLLALLEERSVTRAAARVGLSQPAMSHALRRMRRLLGDDLIVRQGSGMSLTPRGVELIVPLRRALHQTARIVGSAPFDPAVDRRVITVAMTSSTALVIGSTFARLLAERAPHAVLRMRIAPMPSSSMFTEDGVDVMLMSEAFSLPIPASACTTTAGWSSPTPAPPRRPAPAELLATLPHVTFDSSPHRYRPYEVLDAEGLAYTVRQYVSDSLLIPQLIAGAGGVAVHRYRVTTAMSAYLDLRIEEFPFPIQRLGTDMVWNPWLADDEFKSWLRGIFVEAAASL